MIERLWIISCCCLLGVATSDIFTRDVTVKIGRAVYIDPQDIVVNLTQNEICRIEVDTSDPMSQRVGELSPKAFDCVLKPKFVKYTHNGSPLLRYDKVKLRIYKFSSRDAISETVYLNINVIKEPYDIFVTSGLTQLEVEEFNGLSKFIAASTIRFRFDMRNNASCMVGFSRGQTLWPIAGQVVHGPDRKVVDSIWRECHEFMFLQLQYEHTLPPTPDRDYIPLTVEVNDPKLGLMIERMYLSVRIKGAFPNMPPKASFMNEYLLDVDEFILTVISPNIMTATDDETPRASLVYNVSRPLLPNQGHLLNLADQTQAITSFVQADLANRNIAYQPPNISYVDRTDFTVEFTVYDSHFSRSLALVLHISIRPTETYKPRVTLNTGLVLVEGRFGRITNENLQIVDKDNINNVEILVKPSGLDHGELRISGQKAFVFNTNDIASGRVTYHHDGSNSIQDYMLLRISDGRRSIQIRFYFHIIPMDDTSPRLISDRGFEVKQGDTLAIESDMLRATDEDSPTSDIMYTIDVPPEHGSIVRRYRTGSVGQSVTWFSQEEIDRGYIFYQNNGDSGSYDTLKFKLSDQNVPPNNSPSQLLQIDIKPVLTEPPTQVNDTVNELEVLETEIGYLTREHFAYDDPDTADGHLLYTITVQPFIPDAKVTVDSGRLINTRNVSIVMKNPDISAITEFTQAEVNHMLIAFMPPVDDTGTKPKEVLFYYSLSDNTGNTISPQPFTIKILPVNNKQPQLQTSPIRTREGEEKPITLNEISGTDIDTEIEDLIFSVDVLPKHGKLKNAKQNMVRGDTFKIGDIEGGLIVYQHDGTDTEEDQFMVKLSDGVHFISKIVPVDVTLVDDQKPALKTQSAGPIVVPEGGEMIISRTTLSATDPDTTDDKITFVIINPPTKGSILNYNSEVQRFTQKDINEGHIKYLHRGGDVGFNPEFDSFKFVVTDKPITSTKNFPPHLINITILPVNDKPPKIVTGNPIVVKEGSKVPITSDILGAEDLDSEPARLNFRITKKPEWGYFENIKPSKGSEISNVGKPITEFMLKDIQDNAINYVQATHRGVEPLHDVVGLKVMDGDLFSPAQLLPISIIPQNDETPEIRITNFNVPEGKEKMIDITMLNATDADLPGDRLVFSVAKQPRHGYIKMMMKVEGRIEGMIEVPMHDFTLRDLQNHMALMYKHDGSENFEDRYTIKVTDGQHITRRIAKIDIISTNDEKPNIVKNAGLNLQYGQTSYITSSSLWTQDVDNTDDEVFYVIVKKPIKGILQKRVPIGQVIALRPGSELSKSDKIWIEIHPGVNFTQADLLNNRLRYNHRGGLNKMSGDSFVFFVTDGIYSTPYETFEMKIENSKVSEIELLHKGAKVKESGRTVISTEALSATDGSGMPSRIEYFIWRMPQYGQLELAHRRGFAIRNFTQLDIAASKVLYAHTSGSTDVAEDYLKFSVTNGFQTKNGTLYIHIIPSDRITPTLEVNKALPVKRGEEKVITNAFLSIYDPDTHPSNVSYYMMKHPDHGEILNRGLPVMNRFNQSDVDFGNILYKSFASDALIDQFWFVVSDNKHIGFLINGSLQLNPVPFKLLLSSKEILPPKLIRNKMPTMLETYDRGRVGYLINNRYLKTLTFDGSDTGEVIYTLLERPMYGYLEDTVTKHRLNRKFTQKELDEGRILYVINAENQVSQDSFLFKVHDAKGHSVEPTRFDMRWPVIEFSRAEYTVCEDIGTLSVGIKRTGAVDQSAYINVRVKEMSATIGEDIGNQNYAQIQFDPGVTMVTWNLRVREDFKQEIDERFKLLLKSPVNALIGREDKCVIVIINKDQEAGKCPPVPGMLSKYGVVVPNSIGSNSGQSSRHRTISSYKKKVHKTPLHTQSDGISDRRMKSKKTGLSDLKKERRRLRKLRRRQRRIQRERRKHTKKPKKMKKKKVKKGKFNAMKRRKKNHSGQGSNEVEGNRRPNSAEEEVIERKIVSVRKKMNKKYGTHNNNNDNHDNRGPRRPKNPKRKKNKKSGHGKWKKNKKKDSSRSSGESRKGSQSELNQQPSGSSLLKGTTPGLYNKWGKDEGMQTDHTGMQGLYTSAQSKEEYFNPDRQTLADDSSLEIMTDSEEDNVGDDADAWSLLPDDIKESIRESDQTIEELMEKQSNGNIMYVDTCNPTTKGMLHLDRATQLVYKCDGTNWLSLEAYLARQRKVTTEPPLISSVETNEGKSGIDCGAGWREFSGICYKVITDFLTASWDEAEAYCLEKYDAHLPSIWLDENLEWLHDLAGREAFWIGLNQKSGYGYWEYSNGDPVTYVNWKPGYPRGGIDSRKDCAMVRKEDKFWINRECNLKLAKVVCTRYSNLQ